MLVIHSRRLWAGRINASALFCIYLFSVGRLGPQEALIRLVQQLWLLIRLVCCCSVVGRWRRRRAPRLLVVFLVRVVSLERYAEHVLCVEQIMSWREIGWGGGYLCNGAGLGRSLGATRRAMY